MANFPGSVHTYPIQVKAKTISDTGWARITSFHRNRRLNPKAVAWVWNVGSRWIIYSCAAQLLEQAATGLHLRTAKDTF